jgi:hypothetical protein
MQNRLTRLLSLSRPLSDVIRGNKGISQHYFKMQQSYKARILTNRQEGDPKPKNYGQQPGATATATDGASTGVGLYAIILLGGALAFGAYKYLQGQSQQEVAI